VKYAVKNLLQEEQLRVEALLKQKAESALKSQA
jgi:hypothetical protein